MDWTLTYYPLSTHEVLERSLQLSSLPRDLLGDLAVASAQYNKLWVALEPSASSTSELRVVIAEELLRARGISDDAMARDIADSYGDVRTESGILAYPGAIELLEDLKRHYKLGLYTNGPGDMQREKLSWLGIDQLFDVALMAGETGIYKPDQRAFRLLLDRLGVSAEHVLYVGDSYDADIVGAHGCGLHTAWIRRTDDDVKEIQPTVICRETAQLREVLL